MFNFKVFEGMVLRVNGIPASDLMGIPSIPSMTTITKQNKTCETNIFINVSFSQTGQSWANLVS